MDRNLLNKYDGKRYNSFNSYLRREYGERVQKVTVDAGFTCPNRDGKISVGGCIYCNNESFNPGYNNPIISIRQQIKQGIKFLKRRYKVDKFFVYFQPFSNTYAALEKLKSLYEEALSLPQVIGLTIGTRPDCIDKEKIIYLEGLAKTYDITIEYGLESIYNDSLHKINRGHDYQSFLNALELTAGRGIKICTHIILGFPWETEKQWLNEAHILSKLPIDYLKIHHLHIVKNTVLAEQYEQNPFKIFSFDDYINFIISFLERLSPRIIIQRLCGEAPPHILIAPKWGKRNSEIIQSIDNELKERDTWQGKFFKDTYVD